MRERGTTLAEAVVAMAVAVAFVTGAVTARGRDLRFIRETAREAAARRACASRLEELLADRSALGAGTRPVVVEGGPGSLLEGASAEETLREVGPGLWEVEVRVAWTAAGGEPRGARLATLVAAGGER